MKITKQEIYFMGKFLKKLEKAVKTIKNPNTVKKTKEALVAVNNDLKKQITFTKAIVKNHKPIVTAIVKAACSEAKAAISSVPPARPAP